MPPRAGAQRIARYTREAQSRQASDAKSGRFTHASDLLISPFFKGYFEPSFVAFVSQKANVRRQGAAIVELNSFSPNVQIGLRHDTERLHDVGLGDLFFGMEQTVRKLAVVRREENTARRKVESSNRIH
ncbi:MAG: hypothetical protein ABI183_12855, partial [Polyangiaceae bacterium]